MNDDPPSAPLDMAALREAVDEIRRMPGPPPAEVTGVDYPIATPAQLREVILTAEYWRADLAAHPDTLHVVRNHAEPPLYTPPPAPPLPLGPAVIVDLSVPVGFMRLRSRAIDAAP